MGHKKMEYGAYGSVNPFANPLCGQRHKRVIIALQNSVLSASSALDKSW